MLNKLFLFFSTKGYWLSLLILAALFELTGLFYQYYLEILPCVLCIHIRIGLAAIMLLSVLALIVQNTRPALLLIQLLIILVNASLLERAYQLLGVEQGFIMGSCSMDSGLPAFLALDKWFPLIFEVMEPCGYTPELLFSITMAEALIVLIPILLLLSLFSLFALIKNNSH